VSKWDRDAHGNPAAPQQQQYAAAAPVVGAAAVAPVGAAAVPLGAPGGHPPRNVGASVLGSAAGAMPPPSTAAAIVGAAAAAAAAAIGGGFGAAPGAPGAAAAPRPGTGSGSVGFASGGPLPPQGPTHATRHARRLYIGGLAPGVTDAALAEFLHAALAAVGGLCPGNLPGAAVASCSVNGEKGFAFVEFRSVVEASNALGLDGAVLEGAAMRIRRPNDYNAALAANMGPSLPDPALNLSAIGLGAGGGAGGGAYGAAAAPARAGSAGGGGARAGGGYDPTLPPPGTELQLGQQPGEAPQRVFIGGLPPTVGEAELREMFSPFGAILHLLPVKDKHTGEPKGFAFLTFKDPGVIDLACQTLHGTAFGDRTITVTRANNPPRTGAGAVPGAGPPPPGGYPPPPPPPPGGYPPPPPGGGALPGLPPGAPPPPSSRVLVLREAVVAEELADDEEYAEIVEDMREEGGKHGALEDVVIPRPAKEEGAPAVPGVGLVVLAFADLAGAGAAQRALHGRRFGGRTVRATYLSVEAYRRGAYDDEDNGVAA
jgi:splicing factor U2AF subunit